MFIDGFVLTAPDTPKLALIGSAGVPLFLTLAFLGLAVKFNPLGPLDKRLRLWLIEIPIHVFPAVTFGLIVSLFISILLAFPLSLLPGLWGDITPIAVSVFLALVAMFTMAIRGAEILQTFGMLIPTGAGAGMTSRRNGKVVVDTSAIIDGRIADISRAGFIPGTLVIPRFVLNELQHIADSYDSVRRTRGRRGLEMLTKLQKESKVPIEIAEMDVKDVEGVDSKLVQMAKTLGYALITNDFNLNRVAELQGVQVLNINELANAVRPVVLPGEELEVRIIQEGKEAGQGVGFLDDGTMVVVEGGRRHINSRIEVAVTRVLQTAAGRMIFGHPKTEQ